MVIVSRCYLQHVLVDGLHLIHRLRRDQLMVMHMFGNIAVVMVATMRISPAIQSLTPQLLRSHVVDVYLYQTMSVFDTNDGIVVDCHCYV